MATPGKCSGKVEFPHFTLVTHGGLPDVDHSLPYFCPVGRALGRGACWDESGMFWLLWALIAGRFLLSRGAVFPALADGGLPAEAVRRSGAALAYGRWAIQPLIQAWHQVVQQAGYWQAHRYAGFRPVACDLVGFFRPRLSGCLGKHYHSGADKALPAVVCAVVAAVGSLGTVRFPLIRLILRAAPGDQSEADLQRRAVTQVSATLQRDEVLVVDAGFGVAALLTADVTRFVARVARNFTARRNV